MVEIAANGMNDGPNGLQDLYLRLSYVAAAPLRNTQEWRPSIDSTTRYGPPSQSTTHSGTTPAVRAKTRAPRSPSRSPSGRSSRRCRATSTWANGLRWPMIGLPTTRTLRPTRPPKHRIRRGGGNTAPADARTVFGLVTSTESSVNTTPTAPAASALRITVPAFPGSRISTHTSTKPPSRSGVRRSASVVAGVSTTAIIGCGETVSATRSMTPGAKRCTTRPAASHRSTTAFLKSASANTASTPAFASSASVNVFTPSMTKDCSSTRELRRPTRRRSRCTCGWVKLNSLGYDIPQTVDALRCRSVRAELTVSFQWKPPERSSGLTTPQT